VNAIYLDNAATTQVDPDVLAAMHACLTGADANPASQHAAGRAARCLVETARAQVAARVGAEPTEIVFTSGATEANNLAIIGTLRASGARRHLVTTAIEHKSVLDAAFSLEREGVAVTVLSCDPQGRVAAAAVERALTDATALVSVGHVNNEIGVVQDVAAIAAVCRERGVPLHVDAAQSAGKLPLELDRWGIDLCSLSAHKVHGPKGVGALRVGPGVAVEPISRGGMQERGLRAGTLPTHQIVGMGTAFALADPGRDGPRLAALRAALWQRLQQIDGVRVNGCLEPAAPHILNVAFTGVEGESLRLAIAEIACSEGSACASDTAEASHVLPALGLGDALAQSSLRFSVGRFTTLAEIGEAAERIAAAVGRLRALSAGAPAWCAR
jgi:cysteine desulfurase